MICMSNAQMGALNHVRSMELAKHAALTAIAAVVT